MPQKDDKGRYCGVVDVEEKEKSAKFIRRYLRLDEKNGVVEWFTDNPSTLPPASQPQGTIDINFITKVDIPTKLKFKARHCFFIHTPPRRYYFQGISDKDMRNWVEILDYASKIVVPPDDEEIAPDASNSDHQNSPRNFTQTEGFGYTTDVVAGVIIQKKMPTTEELPSTNDESKFVRTLSLPHGGSPKRFTVMTGKILKKGWAVKQGHVRKNWKRRYFVVTTQGFSYFHTDQDTEPIRSIPVSAILTAKEDNSSLSQYRPHLLLVATMERKYYIQGDSREEMNAWIKAFCEATGHSNSVRRRSKLFVGITGNFEHGIIHFSLNCMAILFCVTGRQFDSHDNRQEYEKDMSSRIPTESNSGGTENPVLSPHKIDVSLSVSPQAQRNSSYLGSITSPNSPGNRLSFAEDTFYTRPTSTVETNRNQRVTHLRTASSSEDSSGLGGSVDSLSGQALDSKPLIKKSPKHHSKSSPVKYIAYQRSSSGNELLPPKAPAISLTSIPAEVISISTEEKDNPPQSPPVEPPKTSAPGSISASNASSPRSSGSFSSLQSPRTSRLIQLDPKVDLRAAVKPSTVKRKKNTGILFSLNNMLNKKAEKISSPKEEVKLK